MHIRPALSCAPVSPHRHGLQALGFPLDHDQMQQTGEHYLRSFPVDEYPDLAAHIRHHLQQHDDGDGFEFGLDLILDSLERRRNRP